MGIFYVTKPIHERTHQFTQDEHDEEEWFFTENDYFCGMKFSDGLPDTKISIRRWCQNNLDGDVTVVLGVDHGKSRYSYTFWFEYEAESVAFKLMWA